jgi:hypothetical protein
MANWFRANKMSVNASKTKYIIFRTQNKPVDPLVCNIVYNSTELGLPDDPALISPIDRISFNNAESSFKLLGVLFDEHLCFKPHIDMLCSKISKSLYCLSRVKNFVNPESLRKLYFSMIHSNLSYGVSIYGCATQQTWKNYEKCKKRPSVLYATPIIELIQLHFSKNKKFFRSTNLLNSHESNLCIIFTSNSFRSPLLKLG